MSVPIEQLYQVLAATLATDKATRLAAETALKQLNATQGDIVSLLRVAVEDSVDLAIRLQASIVFKNMCRRRWEVVIEEAGTTQIGDADKEAIRSNLLESIVRSPSQISNQLIECLRMIVYSDFPEQWPTLLAQIETNLSSGDTKRVIGGLSAMRMIARRYEYTDKEERMPLLHVISSTWPALLQLFTSLLSHTEAATDLAVMLKLLLKTFWSSTYLEIPPTLLDPGQFEGWLKGILSLIVRPVPEEGCPEDKEDRAKWPWWKVKKWALHIADRMFSRYGNPKMCKSKSEDQAFCKLFKEHMAVPFLEGALQLLSTLSTGAFVSPRALNLTLRITTHCLDYPYTYPVIKPHVQGLIQHIVFPLMCFNDEDQELWENDPHDYIRKGYDLMEDLYSVRTAASNFITTLCESKKAAGDHMEPLMGFLVGVLGQYHAQGGAAGADARTSRAMDGALLAIGSLAEELKRKRKYRPSIEPMILHHVLPCFASRFGHLRSKACWVAGQFCDTKFGQGEDRKRGAGALFTMLLQNVCERLRDAELPVRVDATVALRSLVDTIDDVSILGPALPPILEAFFQLMGEVENEDLVFTLETIVEKFGDDIAPYAVIMCQNLTAALVQITSKSKKEALEGGGGVLAGDDDDEDDDDMSSLAAYGCLRALSTILDSVSSLPNLYPALEDALFPVLNELVTEADLFEEVLDLVGYIVYYSPTISDRMWSLWPKIHQSTMEWGIDSFSAVLMVLDNFIGRGTERFLVSPELQSSVFELAKYAMTNENIASDEDSKYGAKLLEVVLQQCKGRIDHYIAPYLQITLQALQKAESPSYQDMLITVIANCLYYNAALTLSCLRDAGALGAVLQQWFRMIYELRGKPGRQTAAAGPKHFRRMHDKKVAVLGLTSILLLPDDQLPPEVAGGLPQLVAGIIRLLGYLKDHFEREENESSESEGEYEDTDDEEGDDHDDEEEDEESFLTQLDSTGLDKLAKKGLLAGPGGLDEDEDDDYDDMTDDEEFESPLDVVDAFVLFRDGMGAMQAQAPTRLAACMGGLDAAAQAALHEVAAYADRRLERIAAAKAKEAAKEGAK